MRRNLTLLAVCALATGLIAVGCGDDDDDRGGEALSKEEFVAQANEICKQGSAELEREAEEIPKGQPTPEEQETFIKDSLIPSVQGQIDEIRDLGSPEGDEDRVNGILDDAETALYDLEKNPTFDGGDPFADVNKDLAAYGLAACAEGD